MALIRPTWVEHMESREGKRVMWQRNKLMNRQKTRVLSFLSLSLPLSLK